MLKKRQITTFAAILLVLISGPVFAESSLENLGKAIYNDLNLSLNQNQSCQSCHHPSAGFADPDNRISPTLLPVSDGSIITLFGGEMPPRPLIRDSALYSTTMANSSWEVFFGTAGHQV